MLYFRVSKSKSKNAVPDKATRQLFAWSVHNDPKGTIKTQMVYEKKPVLIAKSSAANRLEKKTKKKKKARKISFLRSSPPAPANRGGVGNGSDDDLDQASSADLRSPNRRGRAPTVPGLGVSPPPPADTPNRMLQRRRSAQGQGRSASGYQLRCRNNGCPEANLVFSSIFNRRRHEQERCLAGIPVILMNKSLIPCVFNSLNLFKGGEFLVPKHSDLNLSDTVCRVSGCGRADFQSWQSRQRHERVTHRFIFRRGFSFAPFNVRYIFEVSAI